MKTIAKYLMVFGVLAMLATGCKKDDKNDKNNPPNTKKELTIGSEVHTIQKAWLENYGTDSSRPNGSTNIDFYAVTDGLELYYDADGDIDSVSGNGYIMWMEVFSAEEEDLKIGNYVFDASSLAANTFDFAWVLKVENGQEAGEFIAMSGDFDLNKSNGSYAITGNLQTVSGSGATKAVKIDYNGTLEMVDHR